MERGHHANIEKTKETWHIVPFPEKLDMRCNAKVPGEVFQGFQQGPSSDDECLYRLHPPLIHKQGHGPEQVLDPFDR